MTDTTTLAPTDAEILNEWDRVSCITFAGQRRLAFARAVLAKWGAPAPASVEAAARALLMDVKARVNTIPALPAVERREYAIRIKQDIADFLAAPPAQEARVPLTEKQISKLWSDAHNDTSDRMAHQVLVRLVEAEHSITAAQKETP